MQRSHVEDVVCQGSLVVSISTAATWLLVNGYSGCCGLLASCLVVHIEIPTANTEVLSLCLLHLLLSTAKTSWRSVTEAIDGRSHSQMVHVLLGSLSS